jgi:hypothetical protein
MLWKDSSQVPRNVQPPSNPKLGKDDPRGF